MTREKRIGVNWDYKKTGEIFHIKNFYILMATFSNGELNVPKNFKIARFIKAKTRKMK